MASPLGQGQAVENARDFYVFSIWGGGHVLHCPHHAVGPQWRRFQRTSNRLRLLGPGISTLLLPLISNYSAIRHDFSVRDGSDFLPSTWDPTIR